MLETKVRTGYDANVHESVNVMISEMGRGIRRENLYTSPDIQRVGKNALRL